MSKKSTQPQVPSIQSGELKIGDTTIAKTYYDPGTKSYVSQYYEDPQTTANNQTIRERLASLFSSLGSSSQSDAQEANDVKEAFIKESTSDFEKEYAPKLKSLREDTAARFGTLTSSDFADRLNNLESNRVSAFTDIITKAQLYKNQILSDLQNNRLSEINSLSDILSNNTSNALTGISASMNLSEYINNLLQKNYEEQLSQWEKDNKFKLFWFQ